MISLSLLQLLINNTEPNVEGPGIFLPYALGLFSFPHHIMSAAKI